MAGKAYIGVGGVARKVKNIYIGVNGVARKVKKVYVGVGGVARQCWSEAPPPAPYYTTVKLSAAKHNLAATTVGSYALFGGGAWGWSSSSSLKSVDAFDSALTRRTVADLSTARQCLSAAAGNTYAFFAGGFSNSDVSYSGVVDAYNTGLTRLSAADLNKGKLDLAATAVGEYVLFGGGETANGVTNEVDVYDRARTKTNIKYLPTACTNLAAATAKYYALFGGGSFFNKTVSNGSSLITDGKTLNTVCAFDERLTRRDVASLSSATTELCGATTGTYAFFAGGRVSATMYAGVETFNSSLTRTRAADMVTVRGDHAGTRLSSKAIFAGGNLSYSDYYKYPSADIYSSSLTRTNTDLSTSRNYLAATYLGNYALFGGGYGKSGYLGSDVDVYE